MSSSTRREGVRGVAVLTRTRAGVTRSATRASARPRRVILKKGASPPRLVPHFAPRLHERRRPRDASATPSATVIRDRYRSR